MYLSRLIFAIVALSVLSVGFLLRAPGEGDAQTSTESGSHSATLAAEDCELLNDGLAYSVGAREGALWPEGIPKGTWIVTIRTKPDSQMEELLGYGAHTYWVQEPVSCSKLQLMEYDFLIRLTLEELLIPVDFLNWLNSEAILAIGEKLHHGWHYLRTLSFPDSVSDVHADYLEATEPAGWYLGGNLPPTTTTMVYRALSEVGVGGARAFGYHCFHSRRLMSQAGLALAELLEQAGISPY